MLVKEFVEAFVGPESGQAYRWIVVPALLHNLGESLHRLREGRGDEKGIREMLVTERLRRVVMMGEIVVRTR